MPVLVKDAAEAVASVDVKAGGGAGLWDWRGQRVQWPGVRDSLVRPMGVAELLELTQSVQHVRLVPDQGTVRQLPAAGRNRGRVVPSCRSRTVIWWRGPTSPAQSFLASWQRSVDLAEVASWRE